MPAPVTGTLDTFNTGASVNLSARAGWGTGKNQSTDATLKTDAVPTTAIVGTSGVDNTNIWNTLFSADQEANFVFGSSPDTALLMLRLNLPNGSPQTTGYVCRIVWNGGLFIEKRNLGGTILTLAAATFPNPAAGDAFNFAVVGTTLTVWRKPSAGAWAAIAGASVVDATYTAAGYIGLGIENGSTANIDTFGGGSLTAAAVVPRQVILRSNPDLPPLPMSRAFTPIRSIATMFSDASLGTPFVFQPAPFGAEAFMTIPPMSPQVLFARQNGVPFVPPADPFGGRAFLVTPDRIALRGHWMRRQEPIWPADPFGGEAFMGLTPNAAVPNNTLYASQAGIPYKPPPDPFGARSFLTPPLLPTLLRGQLAQGIPFVFPPDPFGATAFLTRPVQLYTIPLNFGSRAVFPPDPYGAEAFLTIPLLPQTLRSGLAQGIPFVFPADPYGADAFLTFPPVPPIYAVQAGGSYQGDVPRGFTLSLPDFFPFPVQRIGLQGGSSYKGDVPSGISRPFFTYALAYTPFVEVIGPSGGGGWYLGPRDFPARFPGGPRVRFPLGPRDFPANRQKGRS